MREARSTREQRLDRGCGVESGFAWACLCRLWFGKLVGCFSTLTRRQGATARWGLVEAARPVDFAALRAHLQGKVNFKAYCWPVSRIVLFKKPLHGVSSQYPSNTSFIQAKIDAYSSDACFQWELQTCGALTWVVNVGIPTGDSDCRFWTSDKYLCSASSAQFCCLLTTLDLTRREHKYAISIRRLNASRNVLSSPLWRLNAVARCGEASYVWQAGLASL